MRIFHIHSSGVTELPELPAQPPAQGFLWIAVARPAFQARLLEIQSALQNLVGLQLVDLHVSDLLNAQLPSHYDYTSQYDLLVFRRLATASAHPEAEEASPSTPPTARCATPMQRACWPPCPRAPRLPPRAAAAPCPAPAHPPARPT